MDKTIKLHDEWIIKEIMKQVEEQGVPAYVIVEDLLNMVLVTPKEFEKDVAGYSFAIKKYAAMDFVNAAYESGYTVTISHLTDDESVITIGKGMNYKKGK